MKEKIKKLFETKINRILLILLIIAISFSVYNFVYNERIVNPKELFFYTTDSHSIDIRSPNKKVIIESWPYYDNDFVLKMCNFGRNTETSKSEKCCPYQYKKVLLCNPSNFNTGDAEYKIRKDYFEKNVDELYSKYYSEWIEALLKNLFLALGFWLIVALSIALIKWIIKGK